MGIKQRKQREKERRRQEIMVAAKRVFSKKGYERTKMEDIAREAELSPGTLYLYFKSKSELHASLSLRVLQFINIKLEHVINDSFDSFEQRQHALMKAMFDIYEFDAMVLNNVFHLQSSESLQKLSPELMDEINTLAARALRNMAGIFQEGIDDEQIVDVHPMALVDILWGLFSGIVMWEETKKTFKRKRNALNGTFDTAFEIFTNGMRRDRSK